MADRVEVDLIVEAISKGFDKLTGNMSKVGKAGEASGQKVASGNKLAVGSITDLYSALGIATQAFAIARQVIGETVGVTVEYAKQVREMSMMMGLSADETSRMIQLADDYLISVDEMRVAMQMATKNGFQPGIAGLAELADKYKALASPTERAAMLSEIFGRNWARMVPLLEQGGAKVREQAAAIDDSLVLDEEAIKKTREYEIAVDNLNDKLMGIKIAVGMAVIPALTDYINAFDEAEKALEKNKVWQKLTADLNVTADSTENLTDKQKAWMQAVNAARYAQIQMKDAMAAASPVLDALSKATQTNTAMNMAAYPALGLLEQQQADANNAFDQGALAQRLAAQAAAEADSIYQIETDAIRDLYGAQQELAAAQANWGQSVGTDLASQLKAAIGDTDLLRGAMGALDSVLDTNTLTTYDQEQAMAGLIKELKNTGDIEAFRKGVADLQKDFMPLNDQVIDAQKNVDLLSQKLNALNGKHVTTYLDIITSLSSSGGGSRDSSGGGGGGRAPGGPKFEAAGGFNPAGSWAVVGERGPELVQFGSAARVYSNADSQAMAAGGDTYIDVTIEGAGQSAGAIVSELFRRVSAAQRSGAAAYAGR